MKRPTAGLLIVALSLGGCVSATPRAYAPVVQAPPVDQAVFERDFAACSSSVAAGRRNFGQSGSAVVVGGVGGVAAGQLLGGAALAGTTVGGGAALAATGVGLVVLLPVATYKLSSARRAKNERAIQAAMTDCLAHSGHGVSGWTRASRSDAATTLTPTRRAP